jgi:lipoyl-dependent peroxiredoxin
MQLSHFLAEAGYPAAKLTTEAAVRIGPADGGGQAISKSVLTLRGNVPGMSEAQFMELGNKAKAGRPVSKALGAFEITLDAKLEV